ncbi:MAG: division/cell wall cluster transcriptional repressor MraZ [Candidatus Puniceispirillaceae bacterium]|jgi:MraZ protein|nr:division/cell wall cluster transcriptional repressor MraZ [Pseudomonadota bacterium]
MLFLSTFENKIDAKGRVSIPASFRNTLARSNGGLVLYPNMLKPFIEGCDTNRMAQYAEAADQLDQTSEDAEAYFAMMASAREMRIDSDGRIMLTDELIACAGLSDEALFAGRGKGFEIWKPALYHEHNNAIKTRVSQNGMPRIDLKAASKEGG